MPAGHLDAVKRSGLLGLSAPREYHEELPFDWPLVWRLSGIPTLIVGGGPTSRVDQDRLALPAGAIPGCRFVTVPAGHEVHASAPEEFLKGVRAFVGG